MRGLLEHDPAKRMTAADVFQLLTPEVEEAAISVEI